MEAIYHEKIGTDVAKQILQNEFVSGKDMSYAMITEMSEVTIVQHDNITGKDYSVTLKPEINKDLADVPKIESFRNDYSVKKSWWMMLQGAIVIITLLAVVGCIVAIKIIF